MTNHRKTARDLISMAVDERTPEKERLAAMTKAVRLIHEHDLLSSPLDGLLGTDNQTVRAAATLIGQVTDPQFIDSVKQVARGFTRGRGAGDRRDAARRDRPRR